MNLEKLKELKKESGLSYAEISERSKVPLGTVQKIFGGVTVNPRRHTIEAIEDVLLDARSYYYDRYIKRSQSKVKEAAEDIFAKPIGPYTLKDYYELPDDIRVELIDGYFYYMATPSMLHQTIIGEMYVQLHECMKKNSIKGSVLLSPFDVRLDMDELTMVEPDLMAFQVRDTIPKNHYDGVPDFVIEVLSQSNRNHDLFRKTAKYNEAEVKECWIVDPKNQVVLVYLLKDDYIPVIYSFNDVIPVSISGGKCKVDFGEIYESIKVMLEAEKKEALKKRVKKVDSKEKE